MKRIAIVGGIGAGKTTVTDRLVALGYPLVDADVIAHDVTRQGQPAWRAIRDAFGDAVLTPEGDLDRAFVAEIVFNDATALGRLNRITHGAIGVAMTQQLDEANGEVVFVAIPLFRAELRDALGLAEAWAVMVDPETAVRRLRDARGFAESDARARMASQITNEERSALVDRVIWNEGSVDDLFARIDEALLESGVVGG